LVRPSRFTARAFAKHGGVGATPWPKQWLATVRLSFAAVARGIRLGLHFWRLACFVAGAFGAIQHLGE
jgi:hypothetical protein